MPDIPDVIQAKAFQLVDDNGEVRAELTMANDGPEFRLLDLEGNIRFSVTLFDNDQPSLVLGDMLGTCLEASVHDGHPSLELRQKGIDGVIRLGIG